MHNSAEFNKLIKPHQNRLYALESNSIFLLREAFANYNSLCMLWSIGKDSTVLLWLALKAFHGKLPFPLIHIDTSYKIPEMIAYRDHLAAKWKLPLLVAGNDEAIAKRATYPSGYCSRLSCCKALKTLPLKKLSESGSEFSRYNSELNKYENYHTEEKFQAIIVGLRADEEGSRSKERYFSPRDSSTQWDIEHQPPEFWHAYATELPKESSVRIHPLLDWCELDIWRYITLESIDVVDLYFADSQNKRYRSLGCGPCTSTISSNARNSLEIVEELSTGPLKGVAERSGRAQDDEGGGTLETLRRDGYM